MNYSSAASTVSLADVASLPFLQGVDPDIIRELASSAHMMQQPKGAVFLPQGAQVSRFYVVMEGWCGACKGNMDGQETLLQIFRRGDFLLEAGQNVAEEYSPFNMQALTRIQILSLSLASVRNAIERSETLKDNLLAATVRRCNELRDRIEQLALHSAERRVGRFLLQMRMVSGGNGNEIVLPFDKSMIASYLGIKPETFSRALLVFKNKGFKVGRSHLAIPHEHALCEYCDSISMQACPFAKNTVCACVLMKQAG